LRGDIYMDITEITNTVITLAVMIITAFLIPVIKQKLTAEQRETLNAWVNIGVKAAEQVFTETKQGKSKKQYVLNFLKSKGYNINSDEVDLMIEAAVNKLTTALKG